MRERLAGEVAIVTGSTSGLGREIARLFGAEGARVVVTGRDAQRGAATVASVEEAGGQAVFVAADLGHEDACRALVDATIEHFGELTVLVNNAVAGAVDASDGPVTEVSTEAVEHTLRVNVVAVVWLCRYAIPRMLDAGHGAIVNVSSRVAERATPRLAAYTTSKGALNALTRSINVDYARLGIRCNTVQPGYIVHERRDADIDEQRRSRLEDMHLTRLSTATDVAYAALFLASRESATISGITLPVDGGSHDVRARVIG